MSDDPVSYRTQPTPHGTGELVMPCVCDDLPLLIPQDAAAHLQLDLEARTRQGVRTYGTPLRAHNGRNALVDAYQEALDLAQYLRQWLMEQEDIDTPQATEAIAYYEQVIGMCSWLCEVVNR